MMEQIKDLCLFMICGQTLLYFQSGKKYEKICRMILELLVLAGIVGMILNFLQSLGLQKGEIEAAGGAVAGMQRSMEEALSRQLGAEEFQEGFLLGNDFESLVEKYTMSEIKTKYNYFAEQYGLEIQEVTQSGEKLQVFLKEAGGEANEDMGWGAGVGEQGRAAEAENPVKSVGIEQIEIGKIEVEEREGNGGESENAEKNGVESERIEENSGESEKMTENVKESGNAEENGEENGRAEENSGKSGIGKEELETFRRQLALVFAMDEEKLEVILVD